MKRGFLLRAEAKRAAAKHKDTNKPTESSDVVVVPPGPHDPKGERAVITKKQTHNRFQDQNLQTIIKLSKKKVYMRDY